MGGGVGCFPMINSVALEKKLPATPSPPPSLTSSCVNFVESVESLFFPKIFFLPLFFFAAAACSWLVARPPAAPAPSAASLRAQLISFTQLLHICVTIMYFPNSYLSNESIKHSFPRSFLSSEPASPNGAWWMKHLEQGAEVLPELLPMIDGGNNGEHERMRWGLGCCCSLFYHSLPSINKNRKIEIVICFCKYLHV